MMNLRQLALALLILFLGAATARASEPWCQGDPGLCVTNVTSTAFTISWTTRGNDEAGQVNYGTTPSSLTNTAYDTRGETTSDETHSVKLSSLSPLTPYYFTVTSGGTTYDNSGSPWQFTTGAQLTPQMPNAKMTKFLLSDGVTGAVGTLVYIKVVDDDGLDSPGSSAPMSTVITHSGGLWSLDLNALRTADYQNYFTYSDEDLIFIYADGQSDGFAEYECNVSDTIPDQVLEVCAGCYIDGMCYADAQAKPGVACERCDITLTYRDWSISPTSVICRTAAGVCDVAEACDGVLSTCPTDNLMSAQTVCRPVAGICDTAENCTGSSVDCPADTFLSTTTVCRSSAGVCDLAEHCTGSNAACPTDGFQPTSVECRTATDLCDAAEFCTGSIASCPTDSLRPSTYACRPSDGDCDLAEYCSGSSKTCPTNLFQLASHECRAAPEFCDVAENCTGSTATCPTNVFKPNNVECRASTGDCDIAENCTGAAAACPTDLVRDSTVSCRAAAGACDVTEYCNGTNKTCPTDIFTPSSTQCRVSAGTCDLAEYCTGSTAGCPTDIFKVSTILCRAAPGICDLPEYCTGSTAACPTNLFKPDTTECRGSAGVCDEAEFCTGSSSSCPSDLFKPGDVECRPAADICDYPEYCSGSAGCPEDVKAPSTTICREATLPCDLNEYCTGSTVACPEDAFRPSSYECRPTAGDCDVAEFCTGSTALCPANQFLPSITVCRTADGLCDIAESCTGSGPTCPSNQFWGAGKICRPAADLCDQPEACNGTNGVCPGDQMWASTHICRPVGGQVDGLCDTAEYCTGTSIGCPTDQFQPSSHECRGAVDVCDLAEKCTGSGADCPTNVFKASTVECRASTHAICDPAESCTGSSAACPTDQFTANGTPCDDQSTCTDPDQCQNGACHGEPDSAQYLEVSAPAPAENLPGGTHKNITWNYGACPTGLYDSVQIKASIDGGTSYPIVINGTAPDTGTFDWTVPAVDRNQVRVKILAGDGEDATNNNFTIHMPKNLTVTRSKDIPGVHLTWTGGPADVYIMEGYYDDTPANWTLLASNVTSSWTDTGVSDEVNTYYRLTNAGGSLFAPHVAANSIVHLSYGYALIAVPFEDMLPMTAHDLLTDLNASGVNASTIMMWDSGLQSWLIHYNDFPGFNNFDLQMGVGYFVNMVNPADWNTVGLITQEPFTLYLGYDWSLLGFPGGEWPQAQDVLDGITILGGSGYALYRWLAEFQSWDSHFTAHPLFNNFDIGINEGYFVRNDLPVDLLFNPLGIIESNVTGTGFTVSWTTMIPSTGWIVYGADPGAVTTMAADQWSALFTSGTAHSVTVSGLSNGTYYYDIVISGTIYDNQGNHYEITLP